MELGEASGRTWHCSEASHSVTIVPLLLASSQLTIMLFHPFRVPSLPFLSTLLLYTHCVSANPTLSSPKDGVRSPFYINIFVMSYLNYIFEEFSFIFDDLT